MSVSLNERGTKIEDLDTPALLLDLDLLEQNIKVMSDFFRGKSARMRPHIKTHKSPTIAHKQLAAGAEGIACQKLSEAEVMVEAGIGDVFITNEVVGWSKVLRLAHLAHHSNVTVLVDDPENLNQLSKAAELEGVKINAVVEVDVGMQRCGVQPGQPALDLAKHVARKPGLNFLGILGYEGHCVLIDDFEQKKKLCLEALSKNIDTKEFIEKSGLKVEKVCAGGTSTYAITGIQPGITEIHPGTYATMDLKFKNMGMPFDCAVTLLTSVISNPAPGKFTLDGGLKAISEEYGLPKPRLAKTKLVHLYEEHGLLELEDGGQSLKRGDKVELIPTHGCTTINLHNQFHCVRKGYLESVWTISARGMFS
jgi:D-serine deaminase-like pyridoxal phosphate-dependent protein